MQTYMNFRLLNKSDHFIVAGRINEVCAIWCKLEEPVLSSRKGVAPYNAQCHYDGTLATIPDDTLVIAVMMPEYAKRQQQLKLE